MEQQVRFCTTSDDVRIAYATMGTGPALVSVPNWFSSFKVAAYEPRVASAHEDLAARHQHVLYDRRGTGMSDREVCDFSRKALVKDLEAVIDHLKLRRVALMAWDMAGPVAIEYACRHPEKVTHLILVGCYARAQPFVQREPMEALLRLMRSGWGIAAEIWPTLVMPGADAEIAQHFFTALRESSSGEAAAAQMEAALQEDVRELLPHIKAPTLVLHPRQDRAVPFEAGSELASLIPNARLVPLPWDVHWDPRGTGPLAQAVEQFLTEERRPAKAASRRRATALHGLCTIMFTDMEGSTALTQRLGDEKAQELLRQHNGIIREALRSHEGSEIKHTGDGIMASFAAATKALGCAVAIQREFAANAERTPEPAIRVRIGLNAGEPVAEDEDLFGTAVQMAARVCAHAEPGQIVAANVVRELAAGKGFLFSDQGDVALRGFEDPVRLYAVRWSETE